MNLPIIWRILLSACKLLVIFCIRKHFSNYAKYIRSHHIKISSLSDQTHGIFVSLVYAPSIMSYFAFDFSKSKIECRNVSVHFTRFTFQKSGIIRLTDLFTCLLTYVDHEYETTKRKTRQCTRYLVRKPTFQRERGYILLSTQIQDGTLVPFYSSGKSPALLPGILTPMLKSICTRKSYLMLLHLLESRSQFEN